MDTSEEVAPLAQIERAETELYRVAEEGGNEGKVKSFGEATRLALEQAEHALNSGGHLSGVTTGIDGINAKIGGLHKSDLSILAGRPGMGKTSLATNIAFACAQRFLRDQEDGIDPAKSAGAAVAFFSLEMSADQLATRILAEQSGISSENLRMGKISQQEFRHLARAAGELQALPLYIDDTPGLTIAALRARARRLKRQKGIGMVVVDYLQLLSGHGQGRRTTIASRKFPRSAAGLKQLAKELDLPVLALSQLSRAVEQREDKRPMLSDLRESGSIEQDADIVLFVYREDYYVAAREPKRPIEGDDAKIFEAHETVEARHGARLWHGRTDRRQAAPRRDRQGPHALRQPRDQVQRPDRRRPHARIQGLAAQPRSRCGVSIACRHGRRNVAELTLKRGRLIDHIQLVVRDLEASRRFYEPVLDVLGIKIDYEAEGIFGADELAVSTAQSPEAQRRADRPVHIAFQATDRAQVEAFYRAGLDHGGRDNGAPGERDYHPGYYGAFLLDPDGNNIEAVYHGEAERSAAANRDPILNNKRA